MCVKMKFVVGVEEKLVFNFCLLMYVSIAGKR